MNEIKLTKYSHGAGCGCKISPKILNAILKSNNQGINDLNLLVSNDTRDDAAVYDMENGTAIISTTDFFMPIVDDPFSFGKIAAANAISDIYAMGGKPLLAIAILGWPISKLEPQIANQVLEGGRFVCKSAGISIAGGHSIDSPEPIFGLAVTGIVDIENLKKNNTANSGCHLLLTKPLGVGILTTAQKQEKLKFEHQEIATNSMEKLNNVGFELGAIRGVKAMTDVTGFGLLGHLTEMCESSNVSAIIEYDKIPRFAEIDEYIAQGCIPGGTNRNWDSYGDQIKLANENQKLLLADPQTSGGLLIAVEETSLQQVKDLLKTNTIIVESFGRIVQKNEVLITVL